jgi:hypothetical protein
MTQPATRRINRGRGHGYQLDGDRVQGVTDILKDGVAKGALVGWGINRTAAYAVDHWDDLAAMKPSDRLATLKGAAYGERDASAGRGTDIHTLAHRLAAGEDVEVPEALVGHVDAYLRFVDEWAPTDLHVEATVVNRTHRYMGTVDLVAGVGGATWLLDWKTSGSGVFPETALQLAAYANAEAIVLPDGAEVPMPAIDRAAVVWLRADGYDVVPVDIGPDTFRVFLYAQQMALFVGAGREHYIGDALTPAVAS